MTCKDCKAPLGKNNKSGFCRKCVGRAMWRNPDHVKKQRAGIKRKQMVEPEYLEKQRAAARALHGNPKTTAKRRASAKRVRLWEIGHNHCHTDEANAKRAASRRATALAWCPPHLRDEYMFLRRTKRLSVEEARQIILDQEAQEVARLKSRMEAF